MFFTPQRSYFFRPMTGVRREIVAECLKSFHQRLFGAGANYAHHVSREELRNLFAEIVQRVPRLAVDQSNEVVLDSEIDEASALIRELLETGWLETYTDPASLRKALRFTRSGKLFAQTLLLLDKTQLRTAQRNVRSCRNMLAAFLRDRDVDDLVDAHDFSGRIVADLSEDIERLQEQIAHLLKQAQQDFAVSREEFLGLLERFGQELKVKMVADNAERHRADIRRHLDALRALDATTQAALDAQLLARYPALLDEAGRQSPLEYLAHEIEHRVNAACEVKLPELTRVTQNWVSRFTDLMRQIWMLEGGLAEQPLTQAVMQLAGLNKQGQAARLDRAATHMATVAVQLVDPARLQPTQRGARQRATTVQHIPKASREALLAAALQQAEAFAFDTDAVLHYIHQRAPTGEHFKLSDLAANDPLETLQHLHSFETLLGSDLREHFRLTKLDERYEHTAFSADDYAVQRR